MMVSPPASPNPDKVHHPSTAVGLPSHDPVAKQANRPPSSFVQRQPRSSSRLSQSSSKGGTRASDDDAKTSVKVVVRVRPPLGPSDPGYDLIPQRFQRSMVQVNTNSSLGVDSPQGRKIFIFDRVFGAETTQKGVWEYLEDSVDSFLQGYNVSIMAYGQSGSGKSYTMGTAGPAQQQDVSAKGVIPRAAAFLFDSLSGTAYTPAHSRQNSGLKTPGRYAVGNSAKNGGTEKDWQMSVTYVEIYNEQPRDLLLPEATPVHERPTVQIREDPKGRIFVEGLKSVPVNSIDELMAVLNHGSSIRQTDATAVNSKSSRSHAVFTISLRQNKTTGGAPPRDKRQTVIHDSAVAAAADAPSSTVAVESKLHFVDLAGSERLKNTGATGDRAKEGISINAGLASLGKVIAQLSSRSGGGHVSYRDSKLTRMLQDSLGGNAITYMVACVTPAEFHLSETLNTVQYAQRARNIQSKPKIQQITDDADKQAVIDRLKTEVAFLRQQIRSAEGGDRRTGSALDRPHERELDLQNQLLDAQESYNTLSQRHAKLISELTRSPEDPDHTQPQPGDSAIDRLRRSQENQQQIEQTVLEYEKTIQTLEHNLQTTRGSLAQTESSLLEKETKVAYIETMNQQLNARVQKLIHRESTTEGYLRDLEARLDEQSSGGEQQDAIVADLRKEIARVRVSETNAEDYICTLEERLAEADQDMEIMQREVERLEQLVERQRSLSKLDNLLYELDHSQAAASTTHRAPTAVTPNREVMHDSQARPNSLAALKAFEEHDSQPQDDELRSPTTDTADTVDHFSDAESRHVESRQDDEASEGGKARLVHSPRTREEDHPSPAQQKYVAEKFESVSQELFDLKIEHENTVTELDLISAKYHEALRTLAEMQDSFDEVPHRPRDHHTGEIARPDSYASETHERAGKREEADTPTSQSLSSELSMTGETGDPSDVTALPRDHPIPVASPTSTDADHMHQLMVEHENSMKEVSDRYSTLRIEHEDALKTIEKLKGQLRNSPNKDPTSPNMPGMIRRMTSNVNSGIDRGQRSIVSLRAFLAEEFESKPENMESVEVHLTSAAQEMQNRNERIAGLETELKNVRKEMEVKSTIISGLTRERNSVRAGTPVDLSMVSQLRDQIIQKETELKSLHEGYGKREQELQAEIERLGAESRSRNTSPINGSDESEDKLASLREELTEVGGKHDAAVRRAEEAEKRVTSTIAELEATRATIETLKAQHAIAVADPEVSASGDDSRAVADDAIRTERTNYEEAITQLKHELDHQVTTNAVNAEKLSELVKAHAQAAKEVEGRQRAVHDREGEIKKHKRVISDLNRQMKEAQAQVEFHRHGLKSLHETHADEIEEMKLSHAGILAGYDDKIEEMSEEHLKELTKLVSQLEDRNAVLNNLVNGAQIAIGHDTSAAMLAQHIQDLVEEKSSLARARDRLATTNAELERQLDGRQSLQDLEQSVTAAHQKLSNYQETIRSLANEVGNHEETIREKQNIIHKHEETIESLNSENNKKITLIEELEQQLQSSFEQHQNRVSVVQAQGNQALVEAQNRIASLEHEVRRSSINGSDEISSRSNTMKSTNRPQSPGTEKATRSDSLTSNLRKSASIASLPSPPPAIPLPPLPTLPGISATQPPNPSPPQSRHQSKEVVPPVTPSSQSDRRSRDHDFQTIRRQSAIIEDQETRLRTIEKHLHAEKQLTATLEEALVDLETQSNKLRVDAEGWKKKAWTMEEELASVRKERRSERLSVQAVEEEVKKRREAEAARAQLEERMRLLQGDGSKKKKQRGALNCF